MKRLTLPLIALGLALLITQIAHAESAHVRLFPSIQSIPSGEHASLEIRVESITDPDGLGSYGFAFDFDPEQLTFESFVNGEFLGSTKRSVICFPPTSDRDGDGNPDPGYIRFACATQGAQPPGPTGNGTLGTLTFVAKCPGHADITYDPAWTSLSDPLGGTFDVSTVQAAMTVTGTPCATPTPPVAVGDTDCDGEVTAIDAALILQLSAGIVDNLECEDAVDVNGDGASNAVDAALVLQFVAGIIDSF